MQMCLVYAQVLSTTVTRSRKNPSWITYHKNRASYITFTRFKGQKLQRWIPYLFKQAMSNGNKWGKKDFRPIWALGKTESGIIKSLKSEKDKDSWHYSVLNTTPNHLRSLCDSSEDTRALIKMSLIHFGKSLHYIPITFPITAILLYKINSIISWGKSLHIYRGPLKLFPQRVGCRVKTLSQIL